MRDENLKIGSRVEVQWHDGWRRATVTGLRSNDYSVKPGCVRVNVDANRGCAQGRYNVPLEQVRIGR